jgi:hypothetical protein
MIITPPSNQIKSNQIKSNQINQSDKIRPHNLPSLPSPLPPHLHSALTTSTNPDMRKKCDVPSLSRSYLRLPARRRVSLLVAYVKVEKGREGVVLWIKSLTVLMGRGRGDLVGLVGLASLFFFGFGVLGLGMW